MTSINAIQFDKYSGAMVCDEQRHWNPERLKIYAADKVRSVVPDYIREKYGLAACYGNTGTSAIGDELRLTIYREIENLYQSQVRETGNAPEAFLSIGEVARLAWRVICRMKHTHVDEALTQKHGFTTAEFIQEKYSRNGKEFEITNQTVIDSALESVAKDPKKLGADAVFGNGGIIAGYDKESGYRIYQFSMKEGFVEPVESGYVALGSGGDTTNFVLPGFFNTTGVLGRSEGIDRVDGVIAVVDAVNMAADHNLGVGGYFNVILMDQQGKSATDRYREINDHRIKLASEAIRAQRTGFVKYSACKEIVAGLFFKNKDVDWAEKQLWESSRDTFGMHRMLRGYPVAVG